jgi:hypothetical protein
MSQSNPQTIEGTAPSLDEIVEAYDLTILRGPGDWTIYDAALSDHADRQPDRR